MSFLLFQTSLIKPFYRASIHQLPLSVQNDTGHLSTSAGVCTKQLEARESLLMATLLVATNELTEWLLYLLLQISSKKDKANNKETIRLQDSTIWRAYSNYRPFEYRTESFHSKSLLKLFLKICTLVLWLKSKSDKPIRNFKDYFRVKTCLLIWENLNLRRKKLLIKAWTLSTNTGSRYRYA